MTKIYFDNFNVRDEGTLQGCYSHVTSVSNKFISLINLSDAFPYPIHCSYYVVYIDVQYASMLSMNY